MRVFPPPSLEADVLIERARRRTGLADFGSTQFDGALRILLRSAADEADLSLFGRIATQWDTVRFLSNLLRLHHEETRVPAILDQPIARPIFITGLPRSGTTFLCHLLAEDRGNLLPRVWQAIFPYPPMSPGFRGDRRIETVAWQLRMFRMLAPKFAGLHPIEANSPQECSEITAHVFASLRFDTTYFIPSYRHWLDGAGHLEPYRFHRRFLQHLQHQAPDAGRWVLKCPDHVFALHAIRAVYPDARMVFVHRDPLRVLPSLAQLTEVVRRPFTRHFDRGRIGRQESDRWLAATELMIAADEQQPFAEPICHLHHKDLVSDPLGTVETLYKHFGLALGPSAAARIGRLTAAKPNGGYSLHSYRFEDHGLDAGLERERYARYSEHFAITREDKGETRSLTRPFARIAPVSPGQVG
jgi:Sulfotransferase family